MNTLDILKEIMNNNSDIISYRFHTFPSKSLLQDAINLDEKDIDLVNKALGVRDKYRLPFWDSIMLSFFGNENYSKTILHQALHHNQRDDLYDVNRDEFLSNGFFFNKKERLAINSNVILKQNKNAHIPMLDFHIPVSESNLDIVIDVLKELKVKGGYILESGESYHFIGDYYINEEFLIDFLAKALFFAPIIDRAWIGHQILERSCSLRIDKKHGIYPRMIRYISNIM